ncbi:MAG: hypothetical protein K6U80_19530 [Firmicutes bacterium]|nr:hypothetical protein [Bacillota bacterium]
MENPDGTYVAYTYDDENHRVTATDQAGRSTVTQESYAYADIEETGRILCRIVAVTAPGGETTRYYYSMEGDLLQVTDAKGQNRITKYDNLHRVILTKDPFKGRNTFVYDAAGRLKRKTDNKGVTVEYEYDALGRMTAKRFPSGREIRYIYDLTTADDPIHTDCLGRLAAFVDQSGMTRFGYDAAGRLVAARRNDFGPVRYEYDYTGRVTTLFYPNGYRVDYRYELGRVTAVSDPLRTLAVYSDFTAYGLARKAAYGNGTVTNYNFDPKSGRLTGIRINGGQLLDLAYTYDAAGNIAAITDRTPLGPAHPRDLTETYVYDVNNRLISATGPYGTKTYEYECAEQGRITQEVGSLPGKD